MVAGGLDEMSSTTRLMPRTSFVMRDEIFASRSCGKRAQSAVMELSDYLRVLRAHWTGVVALILASIAAAAVFNLTQPKVYAANATGFVSAGNDSNPALGSVADTLAKSRAKSYVDIAQSRATAQGVIDELSLKASPSALIGNISVDQPLDTVLIKITARASTPIESQQLADAWVKALAKQVAQVENPSGKGKAALKVVPIEAAALPTAPISPRTRLNLLIGLVIGVLLGLAYALVRNQLDRRLRSASAVEKQFGVTVAGAIPAASDLSHDPGKPAAIAVQQRSAKLKQSESAEAFRKLRTNLQFMSRAWIVDGESTKVRDAAIETGFLRPQADGTLEWLLTHNTGFAEVYHGTADGPKIEVSTDAVVRTETAKEYVGGHRMYGLVDGDLLWAYDMAAMGQELQPHLWGRLVRQ